MAAVERALSDAGERVPAGEVEVATSSLAGMISGCPEREGYLRPMRRKDSVRGPRVATETGVELGDEELDGRGLGMNSGKGNERRMNRVTVDEAAACTAPFVGYSPQTILYMQAE